MSRTITLLPLLCILIFTTCQIYEPSTEGTVSGSVYPLDVNAAVSLKQEVLVDSMTVAADGTFRLKHVPAGNYWVEINADGYGRWENKNVKVEPDQVTYLGQIHLWDIPWPLRSYSPKGGEVVGLARLSIDIYTKQTLSTSTIEPAFSIMPALENMVLDVRQYGGSTGIVVKGDFKIGRSYTYTFDNTALTVFDEPLQYPLVVTFETEPFALTVQKTPEYSHDHFALGFNAPIDYDTVLSFIDVSPPTTLGYPSFAYSIFSLQFPLSNPSINIGPIPAWRPGTTTTITISGDLPADGGAVLGADTTLSFYIDSLAVSSTYPGNLQTGVSLDQDITILFNSTIDDSTVAAAISINPDPGFYTGPIKGFRFPSRSAENIVSGIEIYPDSTWDSLTTYTVKVDTTIRDYYGGSMSAPYEFSFTTR